MQLLICQFVCRKQTACKVSEKTGDRQDTNILNDTVHLKTKLNAKPFFLNINTLN